MKKFISVAILGSAVLLSGCAKTMPNQNITTVHPGDENASCLLLQTELTTAKTQLSQAQHDASVQTGANIANGIVGFFDIINWFFIDTGNGHDIDAQNAQARIQHLQAVMAEKSCR